MNDIQQKELEIMIEIDKIFRENNLEYFLAYGTVLGAVRHKGFIPWDSDIDIVIPYKSLGNAIEILEKNLKPEFKVFHKQMSSESYDSLKPRVGLTNSTHHDLHVDIFPIIDVSSYEEAIKINKKAHLLYKIYFLKNFNPFNYHGVKPLKLLKHSFVKIILLGITNKKINTFYESFNNKKSSKDEAKYLLNICGTYKEKEIIPIDYYGSPVEANFEGHKFYIPENFDLYLTHLYGDYMKPKKY